MQGGDCVQPAGTLHESTDCDDGDDSAHPGAAELALDSVDNDCDPQTSDEDAVDNDCDGTGVGCELSGDLDLVSSALDAAGTDAAALILGVP